MTELQDLLCYAALRPDPEEQAQKEEALAQALAVAPHVIRGGKYRIGS